MSRVLSQRLAGASKCQKKQMTALKKKFSNARIRLSVVIAMLPIIYGIRNCVNPEHGSTWKCS
jgi:hypothetical protein